MEEHLSELRKDVEQRRQHMDPAANAKYNNNYNTFCTVVV